MLDDPFEPREAKETVPTCFLSSLTGLDGCLTFFPTDKSVGYYPHVLQDNPNSHLKLLKN